MKHPIRPALSLLLCLCLLFPLVLAFSACDTTPADRNAVTSVTLDGDTITVKAVLTEGFLSGYTEKKVYLFELPSEYSTDIDLDELDPVTEVKPKATLKVTLPVDDGVRSRLYSSFLVASYDAATRRYTALTTPMAVSNPEAAAEVTPSADTAESSLKGLISDYPADAIRLGISHTVVDVPMDELILEDWQANAVAYVWNGTTAYLNATALAELDETVGIYTASGVQVYLRFRLGGRSNPQAVDSSLTAVSTDAPAGLYVNGAASDAEGYAVNMSTAFSANVMEGFFDFMADRYATPEDGSLPVTAFIIGYRVNDAATYANAGDMGLSAYVTNYEKLVRVAHTALKSHNPDGRVYISLDSHRSAQTMTGGWDVPSFLSAFRDECALRGDYDWHVACELYADTPTVWEEDAADDASYYTVHSLSTLTDLLTGDRYRTPAGEERRLLISGLAIPAVTAGGTATDGSANNQAASYAYVYMTCVQNGHVEALMYSEYADPTEAGRPLCGLWTVEERVVPSSSSLLPSYSVYVPAQKRALYAVFKHIDTTEVASVADSLRTIIGAPYTKLESALAGQAQPVTSVSGTTSLRTLETEHKKATALYTFDGGTLHGLESAGNLTYLELVETETMGTITLHARFDREAVCDPMGVTVTMDATQLIGGKELILDLFAGQLADDGASVTAEERPTVTLRLTRAAKGTISAGDGEILYEAAVSGVSGSSWQTATFDISAFTALLDASDEVTLSILVDCGEGMSHNLGLAGVYVTGTTAASGAPTVLIAVIVAVLILAVAGVFVFLLLRHKKRT